MTTASGANSSMARTTSRPCSTTRTTISSNSRRLLNPAATLLSSSTRSRRRMRPFVFGAATASRAESFVYLWEEDVERRPAAGGMVRKDETAVLGQDLSSDGQSKSRPERLVVKSGSKICSSISGAMPLPVSRTVRRTNRSCSRQADEEVVFAGGGGQREGDRSSARHGIASVDHEIGDHLLHLCAVAGREDALRRQYDGHLHAASRDRTQFRLDQRQPFAHVDALEHRGDSVCEAQNLLGDPFATAHRIGDLFRRFRDPLIVAGPTTDDFRKS